MNDAFRHRTPLQVRFRDIDAFGHVNNAVFVSYLEQARVTYLMDVLGADREIQRLPLILARIEVDFRSPILLAEPVAVTTRADWIGRTSFGLSHRVLAGGEERIAGEARTVLVVYDYESSRPMPVPDDWRARMNAHQGRPLDRERVPAEAAG